MTFVTAIRTDLCWKRQLGYKRSSTSAYSVIRKPMQKSIRSASQSLGGYLKLRLIDEFNK